MAIMAAMIQIQDILIGGQNRKRNIIFPSFFSQIQT